MGLNVYFCDVCGVRVTDVDLRSGHGMLRGQDVICATCLEMGHGKEWLASRGVTAPVSAAALPAAAGSANGHRPQQSASALLDHARDRAVTVEDPPLRPTDDEDTGVASDRRKERAAVEQAELEADEVLEPVFAPVRPVTIKAEPPARESTSDFAGAAASFAALGNTPPPSDNDDADEDVEAEASAEFDPSLLTPSSSSAGSQETDEVVGAAALAAKSRDSAVRSSGKGRDGLRRSVSKSNTPAVGRSAGSKKTSSSIAATIPKKSTASAVQPADKSTSSRITKPKSGRSKRTGVAGGMPIQLKISLITIPIILLLAIGTYVGPQIMGKSREPDVKDMPAQRTWIEKRLSETKATINDAVDSKDLKKLQAANEAWIKFNTDFTKFCDAAKQYSKWTDENCDTYSGSLKIFDLGGRMKLIRDEMVKQMNSH